MKRVRRNFNPTPEESLRKIRGRHLGIKAKAIPLYSEIDQYTSIEERLKHGNVEIKPWIILGTKTKTFTLRFQKNQLLKDLLINLHKILGKNFIDDEIKSVVIQFKEPISKNELEEKLKQYFSKVE